MAGSPAGRRRSSRRCRGRPTSTGGSGSMTSPGRTPTPRHSRAAGLLTPEEEAELHRGLDVLSDRFADGDLVPDPSDEDVHGALERLLIDEVGPDVGGRLRAGRSRNDQIATLFRCYLLDHSLTVGALLLDLVDALAGQARGPPRRGHAGPHPPPARPARAAAAPPAGARLAAAARRRPAGRLAAPGRGRLAVRLRRARRPEPRPRPRAGRAPSSTSPAPPPTRSTAPPPATSSPSSRSSPPRSAWTSAGSPRR